ncbi:MAG TPA: hypothetical protein VEB42_04220 [Chitinophagaceae bacterium]|nr:hypothetical protein [Chitinophagaceae bacterium]
MRFLFIVVLAACILGCNNEAGSNSKENEADTSSRSEPVQQPGRTGCYQEVIGRDTIALTLEHLQDRVSGRMTFDNFEKDGSTGTVEGVVRDSIIQLIYSFMSEGMHSVMEIYLKRSGDSLLRGVGEIGVKGDTAYFKDPAGIRYSGNVLQKIPCEQLAEKYRK